MIRPATEADLPPVEEAERTYTRDVEPGQESAWTAGLDRDRALWRADPARALYGAAGSPPAGEDGAYLRHRRTAVPAAG